MTHSIKEDNSGAPFPVGDSILTDSVGRPFVPEAVVAQEARGQHKLVQSSLLPVNMGMEGWAVLEAFGLEMTKTEDGRPLPLANDDLFTKVTLPQGWSRQGTSHNLYSDVLDEQGRKRINVGYKAAFYDRWASGSLCRLFNVTATPEGGWDNPNRTSRDGEKYVACVQVGEDILYTSPPCAFEGAQWFQEPTASDVAFRTAREWLDLNRPGWRSPIAYWDNEAPRIETGTLGEMLERMNTQWQQVRPIPRRSLDVTNPLRTGLDAPVVLVSNALGMATLQRIGDREALEVAAVMWEPK